MNKVVLVFEGVPCRCTPSGAAGALYLHEPETSSWDIGTNKVTTAGKGREATWVFASHTLRFLDEGRRIVFRNQEFDVGDDRPTLVIAADGTARMIRQERNKVSEPAPQVGP